MELKTLEAAASGSGSSFPTIWSPQSKHYLITAVNVVDAGYQALVQQQ